MRQIKFPMLFWFFNSSTLIIVFQIYGPLPVKSMGMMRSRILLHWVGFTIIRCMSFTSDETWKLHIYFHLWFVSHCLQMILPSAAAFHLILLMHWNSSTALQEISFLSGCLPFVQFLASYLKELKKPYAGHAVEGSACERWGENRLFWDYRMN